MFKVVVDYAWLEKIQDVLMMLAKYKGRIDSFEPVGRAGNPNLVLRFAQRGDAVDYLRERYPDDSLEFCNERVIGPLAAPSVIGSPFALALIRRLLSMHAEIGEEADNRLAAEVVNYLAGAVSVTLGAGPISLSEDERKVLVLLLQFHFDDPENEYYPFADYKTLCQKFGVEIPA